MTVMKVTHPLAVSGDPRRGHALIEVIIASLLLALMTVPVMTAAFSGRQLGAKTQRRLQAAWGARRVAESLKGYVVADRTLASGPGTGDGGWYLPGDASGLSALEPGRHELLADQWLPELAPAPYNGRIAYVVTQRATPQGPQANVSFDIQWTEP